MDPITAQKYLENYKYINQVFQKNFGYKVFFIGGTLLGCIRENDFLQNDKDMDIAYFSKYNNVNKVSEELTSIVIKLINLGEDISLISDEQNMKTKYIWWRIGDALTIDIMPMWYQNDHIYRPTFVGYNGDKKIILPLKEYTFKNEKVYLPNQPEKKLSKVYGENWRIPDKNFSKRKMLSTDTTHMLHKLNIGIRVLKHLPKSKRWNELSTKNKIKFFYKYAKKNLFKKTIKDILYIISK